MWLTSYDPEDVWSPVEIELCDRVRIGERDDWAWARVATPIDLYDGLVSRVLIGARHRGDNVWAEPERWPMHVYLCTVAGDDAPTAFPPDQVNIARWGLLHQSQERAKTDKF